MAKKSKSNSNIWAVVSIIEFLIILYFAQLLQEKGIPLIKPDKNGVSTENSSIKEHAPVIDEEKVKKLIQDKFPEILNEKPATGSKWFVNNIKFLKPGLVLVEYEDGHTLGSLTLKISDQDNYKTWEKIKKH